MQLRDIEMLTQTPNLSELAIMKQIQVSEAAGGCKARGTGQAVLSRGVRGQDPCAMCHGGVAARQGDRRVCVSRRGGGRMLRV